MIKIKGFNNYIIDEGISWESVKDTYKRAKEIAVNIFNAFRNEGRETSEMMRIFNHQIRKKLNLDTRGDNPTPEEIKMALEQLKDIPRLAPYAIILLSSPIPFSGVMYTAFGMYLKRISGGYINLLPGSFNNIFDSPEGKIVDEKNMRHLKEFKLFESEYWKFHFPENELELESLIGGPDGKSIRELMRYPEETRYKYPEMTKGKSILLGNGYLIRVSKSGNIVYGTLGVYPHFMPVNQKADILIDFLTIYAFCISKKINYPSVEEFVYLGKGLTTLTYRKCMDRPNQFGVIIDIAKKYNDPSRIESVISNLEEEQSKKIPFNLETLNKSRAYRFFSNVYGFTFSQNGNYLSIGSKYLCPFGIFDTGTISSFSIYIERRKFNYKKEKNAIDFIDKEIISFINRIPSRYLHNLSRIENGDLIILLTEALLKIYDTDSEGLQLSDQSKKYEVIENILDYLRLKDPVSFSSALDKLDKVDEFKDLVKDYKEKYHDSFRSGKILGRFKL